MKQSDCVFCKIVEGTIPSDKIYEDEHTVAFLDISPVNIGHTLVIPKDHYPNIYETPEDIMGNMMKTAKKISIALRALDADGVNVTMNNNFAAGQVVFHSHIHVIPRFSNDGFELWHGKRGYNDGEKSEVAQKIIAML
jgi:histidine triad (HIT) family protein